MQPREVQVGHAEWIGRYAAAHRLSISEVINRLVEMRHGLVDDEAETLARYGLAPVADL